MKELLNMKTYMSITLEMANALVKVLSKETINETEKKEVVKCLDLLKEVIAMQKEYDELNSKAEEKEGEKV